MRICIDAGHGGKDPGAVSEGVQEKDINLAIVKKLEKKLTDAGYSVLATRKEDKYVGLNKRAWMANNAKADIFVSIHNNAAANETVQGTETLYYTGSKKGEELARLIQEQLLKKLQRPDRGIKERKNLVVLNSTVMPAILVECGFLTNPIERKLLQDEGFQQLAAEAILEGLNRR